MQRRTVWMWIALIAAAFAAGVGVDRLGGLAGRRPAPATTAEVVHQHAAYVCPMHPQVVSDKPGTCPICGMALVPAEPTAETAAAGEAPTVQIAPEVIQNFGVRTMRVKRTSLVRRIETPGFVQQIEPAGHTRVSAPFDAHIAALPIRNGQWVEQGALLAALSSETLRAAEQAHVELLTKPVAPMEMNAAGGAAPTTAPAGPDMELERSRERLARLGLSSDDIQQLEQKRTPSATLTLVAPFPGMIDRLQVKPGAAVTAGTALFELTGMARATVLANAFQRDAAWIQTGQLIEVRLPHVSSKLWPGVVNQGAVSLDPNSQNIGVRLSFSAPAHLLKSAMYVVATVEGDAHHGVLAVPAEAVIRTETGDRVIVALGGGRFKPVAVRTGIETGGQIEIQRGLKEGDEVVVSAQFLIDSESSLQASFGRMTVR